MLAEQSETCEIHLVTKDRAAAILPLLIVRWVECYFIAVAEGSNGNYEVARSNVFAVYVRRIGNAPTVKKSRQSEDALNILREKLTRDHWYSLSHGEVWHSERFKRDLTSLKKAQ